MVLRQDTELDNANTSDRDRNSFTRVGTPSEDVYTLSNLFLSYDFGGATLLSSTGYLDRDSAFSADLSSLFVPILPFFGIPDGSITDIGFLTQNFVETRTQELRLASNGDSALRWTIGAYYRDSETRVFSPPASTAPDPAPFSLLDQDITDESESWAAFGEASYALTTSLEVTLGLRYYNDDRDQAGVSTQFGGTSVDINSASFDSTSPRVSLLYKLTDRSSVYVNAARGFRSGGFNQQSAGLGEPVPPTYDPESLWTYEIGATLQSDDRRGLLQAAVYYNDWKDIQTFAFLPNSAVTITANGGKASGFGVDFEGSYTFTDAFDLSATVGWNDMEYDSETPDHFKGDPLDYVSPLTASATANYRFNWSTNTPGSFRVEYQHADAFDINIRNFFATTVSSEDTDTVRARLAARFSSVEVALFADNLTGEDNEVMPAFGALSEPIRVPPRTIGITLDWQF